MNRRQALLTMVGVPVAAAVAPLVGVPDAGFIGYAAVEDILPPVQLWVDKYVFTITTGPLGKFVDNFVFEGNTFEGRSTLTVTE